jgi:hypothetical protein
MDILAPSKIYLVVCQKSSEPAKDFMDESIFSGMDSPFYITFSACKEYLR